MFFCGRIFTTWQQKKMVDESNKGIFEIYKKKSPYLDQKNLKVTIFRQCVLVGCQN
jgi:hypothetical protein